MARYIDADELMAKLNRKKAEPCNKRYTDGFNDALMRFRSMVHSAPTVSPDEVRGVVRCRECKHTERDGTDDPAIYCKVWDRWEMPEDGFCYKGAKTEVTDDA